MANSSEIVYRDMLAEGFRLLVEATPTSERVYYSWYIEILEADGEVFGVTSDGEQYDSRAAAEVSGRFYYLMNYAQE